MYIQRKPKLIQWALQLFLEILDNVLVEGNYE